MTKEMQHMVGAEQVTVHVTVLNKIEECKEDMQSPFKHGKVVLPPGVNPDTFVNVFIDVRYTLNTAFLRFLAIG